MKTILAGLGLVTIFGAGFICGMTATLVFYGKHPDMGHRHVHEIAEAIGVTDNWVDITKINSWE